MLAFARRSPRIKRVYAYQWQASCNARAWDSGWFRSDGEARPAYRVIVRALARERKLDAAERRGARPPAHARHAHLVHAHRSSGSTLRATMGFMSAPGPLEIMVILVVALLVLGPQRLPEVARSVGKGMRELKDSLQGIGDDDHDDDRYAVDEPEEELAEDERPKARPVT